MTHIVTCTECTDRDTAIRAEVRRNEKRIRAGKPADMTVIEKRKAEKALCAARGHHDTLAGPRARWGQT